LSQSIHGVEIKELATHSDERGFFREVIRETDPFFTHVGQWSHSLMHPGSAKAWHIHKSQIDWWYCIGALKVALHDLREGSPTKGVTIELFMGDQYDAKCIQIPLGVAQWLSPLATTNLFSGTSNVDNPGDEGRIPHEAAQIGYGSSAFPEIK